MIPSMELVGLNQKIRTIEEYSDLDTDEFGEEVRELKRRVVDVAEMLEENGE